MVAALRLGALATPASPDSGGHGSVPDGDWGTLPRDPSPDPAHLRTGYQAISPDAGLAVAGNPAHGLRCFFTPEGVTLKLQGGADESTLQWRLVRVGYGADSIVVPTGEVVVDGSRVEVRRRRPLLTEWFQNSPHGLEQGFTLAEPPSGNPRREPLCVVLSPGGDVSAQADGTGQNLVFLDRTGRTVLTYRKLRVFDAAGAEIPAQMSVRDSQVLLLVQDSAARYPLTIDPTFGRPAYVKASNAGTNDQFGISVAVSGDTAVVGAVGESSGATGVNGDGTNNTAERAGAAYVFVRRNGTWSQEAYLKPAHVAPEMRFGQKVAISGNTIVVGAFGDASDAEGVNGNPKGTIQAFSGAAYVFVRNNGTWVQQAYLKESNPREGDLFGLTVAISGNTAVIGAPGRDGGASPGNPQTSLFDAGSAYVFVRNGTTWTQQAQLEAANPDELDFFGVSVAIDGDTVLVGAQNEDSSATGINGRQADNSAPNSGAAYVFHRSGDTWSRQAYLKAGNTDAGDQFGISVGVSGDTAVVGALNESSRATGVNPGTASEADNGAIASGAAYVFTRTGTTWTQQAYLKGSLSRAEDNFGSAVSLAGDTLVVGAWQAESGTVTNAGAVYLFGRNGSTWSEQNVLRAGNAGAEDRFGASVAVEGGVILAGAFLEDGNGTGVDPGAEAEANEEGTDAGAAYFFSIADADEDGLLDIWESEGGGLDVNGDGVIDLDLFALGARPDHKDLFVEIDGAPLAINPEALARVVRAFSRSPVQNPDKTPGIRLHLEADESGIIPPEGVTDPTGFPFHFKETKAAHFGTVAQREADASADPKRPRILAAKARVYRYCLAQDGINFGEFQERAYNGIAEIGGNDFVVHLSAPVHRDRFRDTDDLAATFMHELGHSLGLYHGGGVDQVIGFLPHSWQGKPNYPSLMNYVLSHPLPHGQNRRFWKLDYCRERLPDLVESSLSETAGISSTLYRKYLMPFGVPTATGRALRNVRLNGSRTDFNGNRDIEAGTVSADLNYFGPDTDFPGVDLPSADEIQKGHDDWANLKYTVNDDVQQTALDVSLSAGCPTRAILEFLDAHVPPDPDSFEGWVEGFPSIQGQVGFADDPDEDGIANGWERFLGTDPTVADPAEVLVSGKDGVGFRHSRSRTAGDDMEALYEWSTDLMAWHASGETSGSATVVLQPAILDDPRPDSELIEVTPVVTGDAPTLFYRIRLQPLELWE